MTIKESSNEGLSLNSFSVEQQQQLTRAPTEIDASLRRSFVSHWVVLIILLISAVLVLYWFMPQFCMQHPVLTCFVIGIPLSRQLWGVLMIQSASAHRLDEAPDELLGNFSPTQLHSLADDVAARLGGVEVPNIYVLVEKSGNAMAINSMLFNFIPRLNSIYLNSYLFKALTPEELQAILVHEIAHFHRYISPLSRNGWLAPLGGIATILGFLVLFPPLLEFPYIIMVLVLGHHPIVAVLQFVTGSCAKDLEYACDSIAAEVVSPLPCVNALLKLGDRAEVFALIEDKLERMIEKNPDLDTSEVVAELINRIPDHPIRIDEAKKLFAAPVSGHDTTGWEDNVTANFWLLNTLKRSRRLRQALRVVHWEQFDFINPDDRLDEKELVLYLQKLFGGQETSTHRLSHEHSDDAPANDHPTNKQRLLYLYWQYVRSEAGHQTERGRRILDPPTS